MRRFHSSYRGFTLTEVVISLFMLVMTWLAIVGGLVVSRYTATYARHKIQAIYFAQRALEEQRRLPFVNIQSHAAQNFVISPDSFAVNRTITSSPVTSPAGIEGHTKKVQVAVTWNEIFYNKRVPAAEYLATDITDESQFN